MYVQALSIEKLSNLSAQCFAHCSAATDQHNKFVSNSIFKPRFCNSAKMASRTLKGLRNHGGLVGLRCEGSQEKEYDDGYYMRRCVELARKAVGCTSPNPMVGCLIVKDGKIVGEGFHPKAGQPHGEVTLSLLPLHICVCNMHKGELYLLFIMCCSMPIIGYT